LIFLAGLIFAFAPLVLFELKNHFIMFKNTFIDKSYLSFINNTNLPNGVKLNKNDPLEKTLNQVVNSGYILWISKLFHILSLIKKGEILSDYSKSFSDFLEEYKYIKEVLLDENFYLLLEEIVLSEVLWSKRHIWTITYEETKRARTIFIWDLKDVNCVIYKLLKMWEIDV